MHVSGSEPSQRRRRSRNLPRWVYSSAIVALAITTVECSSSSSDSGSSGNGGLGPSGGPGAGGSTSSSTAAGGAGGGTGGSTQTSPSVVQYHRNASRDGLT